MFTGGFEKIDILAGLRKNNEKDYKITKCIESFVLIFSIFHKLQDVVNDIIKKLSPKVEQSFVDTLVDKLYDYYSYVNAGVLLPANI